MSERQEIVGLEREVEMLTEENGRLKSEVDDLARRLNDSEGRAAESGREVELLERERGVWKSKATHRGKEATTLRTWRERVVGAWAKLKEEWPGWEKSPGMPPFAAAIDDRPGDAKGI